MKGDALLDPELRPLVLASSTPSLSDEILPKLRAGLAAAISRTPGGGRDHRDTHHPGPVQDAGGAGRQLPADRG